MTEAKVLFDTLGRCGLITLNRPAALNALDLDMARGIGEALDRWGNDPSLGCVVIKGAGDRAFCAGGDIRALYQLGQEGKSAAQLAFFAAEYRLNRRIKLYRKPYIALIDGIVMGGGAGLSVHGSHCIAGNSLTFAMPEVGIGFFPDVGATYFLPRLPGFMGAYLALTGARIGCGDAMALGIACAYVPSARHDALIQRLVAGEDPGAAIAAESAPEPRSELVEQQALIGRCFSALTVAAIKENLAAESSDFGRATLEALSAKSPTSLAIALRQMQIGADLGIDEALRVEFRIAARILQTHDYYEGVRAIVIDKDQRPKWRPSPIEAVGAADIDYYFEPLQNDLTFQAPALAQ